VADKPVYTTVTGNAVYSAATLNAALNTLASAIEDCLGRGGTSESPNSMQGNLDMNLNRIQNLDTPSSSRDAANKSYVDSAIAAAGLTPGEIVVDITQARHEATATDGQTVFTGLPTYTVDSNSLAIYIDGRRQNSDAYIETDGNTVTFTEPLSAGQVVLFTVNDFDGGSSLAGSVTPDSGKAVLWDGLSNRDVRLNGAVIDGSQDCTQAFVNAFAVSKKVYASAGIFRVDDITLFDDCELITDGFLTIFQQNSGLETGHACIRIQGSRTKVGDCTIYGNISTDTGEWSNALEVIAKASCGNLKDIEIGNIRGFDIRGDVVAIGQQPGYTISNVNLKSAYGDNVYRHIFSGVGGDNVEIGWIDGENYGLMALDLEPYAGVGPCKNYRIGYVRGRRVGNIGESDLIRNDNIQFGTIIIDGSVGVSTPAYPLPTEYGYVPRHSNNTRIGRFYCNGLNTPAIYPIDYSDGLIIDSLYLKDCGELDTTLYQFMSLQGISNVTVNRAVFENTTRDNMRVIQFATNAVFNHVKATLRSGSSVLRQSQNTIINHLESTSGLGVLFGGNSNGSAVNGGSFYGEYICSYSNKNKMRNLIATASIALFVSTYEDNFIENSTLNGNYYSYGVTNRNYLMPIRFGQHHVWVDSTGDLRIKSSAPTSDTDGTVVGSQS